MEPEREKMLNKLYLETVAQVTWTSNCLITYSMASRPEKVIYSTNLCAVCSRTLLFTVQSWDQHPWHPWGFRNADSQALRFIPSAGNPGAHHSLCDAEL